MDAKTKARLLEIGKVRMDPALLKKVTIPTAGPGAGKLAFFFRSGDQRVRLGINENSPFLATEEDGKIVIRENGQEIVRGEIEEELIHCPDQAYVNLTEKCTFDCKFCPVPKLSGKVKSVEEVLQMIEEANASGKLKGISITSGVDTTAEKEVERAINVIEGTKKYGVPIGVGIYPTEGSTKRLRDAGAEEIKYNVETMDRELHDKLCPEQPLEETLNALHEAVEIFGRNHVCSNFIIGLGESDETVEKGIKELITMGVVPILRPASMHPLREGEVFIDRPTGDRLLRLTKFLREELEKADLDPGAFKTMCLPCTGCDLSPYYDLE
ncbi:biotin synthase-related radical SAM superfamily protein [Methanohalophilus levihalophilus]|uniref:radical SAM protein n=1 Tax=Methanohalophilus levihalophilus TaxID=1431282 RepID=UPI001AE743EF|nr:radical SAM protein [Methanohalophilus levihalophilus]MBP2029852.1 biotin synthase-related radical SAM superfamily protein [Methanohalophilus levihalophilus]